MFECGREQRPGAGRLGARGEEGGEAASLWVPLCWSRFGTGGMEMDARSDARSDARVGVGEAELESPLFQF